jgi:hypothetical protein
VRHKSACLRPSVRRLQRHHSIAPLERHEQLLVFDLAVLVNVNLVEDCIKRFLVVAI